MSAGGLIAQAVLGGTAQAAKGIGDRIRADAKQARADAMLDKKTEDASQLQKERAKLATEKQKLGHKQKTNRLIKSYELGQETYTDEMGPDGKTVIGQREVGSNRLDKYSTSAGKDMSLTNRQKAFAQSLTDRIKAIDDRAEYGAITPEATERRDAMEVQLNALLAGKGRFSELMNGKGDGQGGAGTGDGQGGSGGDTPGPDKPKKPDPESIGGLVGGAMKTGEKQDRVKVATDQINGLQDEADDLMARLNPPTVTGAGGRPDGNNRPQVSQDDIAAAQDLVQRLLALDNDPATAEALTPRLRNNIAQRIMEFQRAGVPLNLNP
jgi:hypothetical protein